MGFLKSKRIVPILLGLGPVLFISGAIWISLPVKEVTSRRMAIDFSVDKEDRLVVPLNTKPLRLSESDRSIFNSLCSFPSVKSASFKEVYQGNYSPIAQCGNPRGKAFNPPRDVIAGCVFQPGHMVCPVVPSSIKLGLVHIILSDHSDIEALEGIISALDISVDKTNQER